MARIKLIVTGDMEKLALHESLRCLFPVEKHDGEKVEWDVPRKLHCATTCKLSPVSAGTVSTAMKQLAQAMLDEAGIGKKGEPADLVVVIDDVELGNLGQEAVVAEHFRAAVQAALNRHSGATLTRYQNLLRDKCSFHLLKPMMEAYLFGDAKALRIAGVPPGISPRLVHPTDVEQFETNDPDWLPTCHLENGRHHPATPWWCHERHPKHYLEHLAERGQVFYEETRHGKEALIGLDWKRLPKNPTDTPIIRSLFEDLYDWFGVPNPISGSVDPAFYPPRTVNRAALLLRNM